MRVLSPLKANVELILYSFQIMLCVRRSLSTLCWLSTVFVPPPPPWLLSSYTPPVDGQLFSITSAGFFISLKCGWKVQISSHVLVRCTCSFHTTGTKRWIGTNKDKCLSLLWNSARSRDSVLTQKREQKLICSHDKQREKLCRGKWFFHSMQTNHL